MPNNHGPVRKPGHKQLLKLSTKKTHARFIFLILTIHNIGQILLFFKDAKIIKNKIKKRRYTNNCWNCHNLMRHFAYQNINRTSQNLIQQPVSELNSNSSQFNATLYLSEFNSN